jgi:hypothetical protein
MFDKESVIYHKNYFPCGAWHLRYSVYVCECVQFIIVALVYDCRFL